MWTAQEGGAGTGEEGAVTLAFIDHRRQDYADRVPFPSWEGMFLIGEYLDDGGVGGLGEFRIALHVPGDRTGFLLPELCVFGDGVEALYAILAFSEGDLARLLCPVGGHVEFSRRLVALGLRDASDRPLGEGR